MIETRIIMAALIAASIALAGYLLYDKVYDRGFAAAEAKYELIIKDYNDKIAAKIDVIQTTSATLVNENRENSQVLAADINGILRSIKGKPFTIIKNGECVPAPTFSDTINTVNKRVNQSMKDAQK